jgi:hypothetical protein
MDHRVVLILGAALLIGCGSDDSSTAGGGQEAGLGDGGGSSDGAGNGDGTSGDAGGGDGGSSDATTMDGALGAEWLVVKGNKSVHADDTPFRGRGVNFHDERSCEACSFAARDPDGIDRWADELMDDWKASFIRFLLSSKTAPFNAGELQWQSIVDDPAYYADVQQNVNHMTSKGAYVLVTLFADPTMKPENTDYDSEWPGSAGDTNARYTLLAQAFKTNARVLFGLTNEPHGAASHDAELATRYQAAIDAIRAVEDAAHTPHHIVVVQAPEGYARDLTYFVAHPLPGDNIAYEVHPYNAQADFDGLLVTPGMTLPIIIGEYGPAGNMMTSDIMALWTLAQAHGIPHIGWNFHMRCPPNMLQDTAPDGCGLAASTGYSWPRTAWGDQMYAYLRTPW